MTLASQGRPAISWQACLPMCHVFISNFITSLLQITFLSCAQFYRSRICGFLVLRHSMSAPTKLPPSRTIRTTTNTDRRTERRPPSPPSPPHRLASFPSAQPTFATVPAPITAFPSAAALASQVHPSRPPHPSRRHPRHNRPHRPQPRHRRPHNCLIPACRLHHPRCPHPAPPSPPLRALTTKPAIAASVAALATSSPRQLPLRPAHLRDRPYPHHRLPLSRRPCLPSPPQPPPDPPSPLLPRRPRPPRPALHLRCPRRQDHHRRPHLHQARHPILRCPQVHPCHRETFQARRPPHRTHPYRHRRRHRRPRRQAFDRRPHLHQALAALPVQPALSAASSPPSPPRPPSPPSPPPSPPS
ncbi:hypothetical protein Vretifemale_15262, partial [Volvox reticuliferus]